MFLLPMLFLMQLIVAEASSFYEQSRRHCLLLTFPRFQCRKFCFLVRRCDKISFYCEMLSELFQPYGTVVICLNENINNNDD